jgi:hypothetical protein
MTKFDYHVRALRFSRAPSTWRGCGAPTRDAAYGVRADQKIFDRVPSAKVSDATVRRPKTAERADGLRYRRRNKRRIDSRRLCPLQLRRHGNRFCKEPAKVPNARSGNHAAFLFLCLRLREAGGRSE